MLSHKPSSLVSTPLLVNMPDDAEELRMVRHHQKIQRRLNLHPRAVVRMDHRLPPRIPISRLGSAVKLLLV